MIGKRKILAIIPARGGSKGLPRKNVLDLEGKPLIAWSIAAASESQYIDRCIVSTDDQEIADIAKQWGADVPFMRPTEHARDESTTLDVALHTIEQLPDFDIVVILQPTSPLRSRHDIDHTIETLCALQAKSAASVYEPAKSPFWSYLTTSQGRLQPLLDPELACKRRQDLPRAFVLNGAVYAACIKWLKKTQRFVTEQTAAYMMPAERSLDIDTAYDLRLAAFQIHENRLQEQQDQNSSAAQA